MARILGSLANALLDLGLPTIRQWLRERIGPEADVAQVRAEGSLVHLDGVRVPIGSRGMLILDRATAIVTMGIQAATALGRAGLPEMRLHAFHGVLGFGDGSSPSLHVEVSFKASPDPEEAAWIWGELAIVHASSSSSSMRGQARLFVSSREWRLEEGTLDGEIFRARFAGGGVFEVSPEKENEGDGSLISREVSMASLSLEHARVGPFVDVARALAGKGIEIPTFVPLDAELDGALSWSVTAGGKVDLRIASEVLRVSARAAVDPGGRDLGGRIEAVVGLADLLRHIDVPSETLPRDEDEVLVELDVRGELHRPAVTGTITAAELGFRLGRPRFVPPVLVRDVSTELFFKDGRAVFRAVALARATKVTIDLDTDFREPRVLGTLRADVIDAAFLRDLVRTLDVNLIVAHDVSGALELTLASTEVELGAEPPRPDVGPRPTRLSVSGTAIVSTRASKLTILVTSAGGVRITGRVSAEDVLDAGLLTRALRLEGELVVSIDVSRSDAGVFANGIVSAERLVIALADRPAVPPYVLEGATANLAIDRSAVVYDELRFRAHGGRFVANGTIPLMPGTHPGEPRIALHLQEGGAELAQALGHLLTRPQKPSANAPLCLRVARQEERPRDELWLPHDLVARGHLRIFGAGRPSDLSLVVDVTLETPRGTNAVVALRVAHGGALDGSTLFGSIALADLVRSGALGSEPVFAPEGTVKIDAFARGHGQDVVVLGSVATDRIAVLTRAASATDDAQIVLTTVEGSCRLDRSNVIWKDLGGRAYCGSFRSTGFYAWSGAFHASASLVSVAVHELPDLNGHTPSSFIRGRLSATILGRADVDESFRADGKITLYDAAFPVLAVVRPTLAKYGLRPPKEDAPTPVTATFVGTSVGVALRDVEIDLRGVSVRGEIGLSHDRTLDGRAVVTLEEEYLRSSKLLTVPRVLADRIVLPVRIDGPLDDPHVHAELAKCLGRFLKDNRVRKLVMSAVEEARILLGRHSVSEPAPEPSRPQLETELDAMLREMVDAHAADWEEIARREAGRSGRYRVV